jgi:hypothetical protein
VSHVPTVDWRCVVQFKQERKWRQRWDLNENATSLVMAIDSPYVYAQSTPGFHNNSRITLNKGGGKRYCLQYHANGLTLWLKV